jgi:hypothetical protein
MRAHKLKVTIPEDHQLVIRIPEDVPAGPAELIVLVEPSAERASTEPSAEDALQRFEELAARLAADPRPFRELSPEEREARLRQVVGAGRGLFSSTDEFIRRKQEEIDLEERRFGH